MSEEYQTSIVRDEEERGLARPDARAMEIATTRAAQEVQAAMVIAKKFPRDMDAAHQRIMTACKRKSLAEVSTYAYQRGGQLVTGPSIRLAETVAQNYGNLDHGIIELEQRRTKEGGESVCMAYAWDLETNVRVTKVFNVPHVRHTKKGAFPLTDPRDIYEMVANQGARRQRACILGIVPGDVIEAARKQCERTLAGDGKEPIEDRRRNMIAAFAEIGVTKEMIEARMGIKSEAIVDAQLAQLRGIFTSLRDGMSKREEWFEMAPAAPAPTSLDAMAEQLAEKASKKKAEPAVKTDKDGWPVHESK